jgi:hypothetical protein
MPGTLDMASMVTWQTVYCCILRSDCCCYHHILDNIQIGSQFGCDVLHHHHHHHYRQRMCFVGSDGDVRIKSMPLMQARLPRFPKTVLDFEKTHLFRYPRRQHCHDEGTLFIIQRKRQECMGIRCQPMQCSNLANRFVG